MKIYGSDFIMEKNKNIFWFVNKSKYHHREMGLKSVCKNHIWAFHKNYILGYFVKPPMQLALTYGPSSVHHRMSKRGNGS